MNINYQHELEKILQAIDTPPRMLLHSCCAPCSTYVLEYLAKRFDITIDFYNPNIYPPEEFDKRSEELRRFISDAPFTSNVMLKIAPYDEHEFYNAVKGLEAAKEGGERCFACYRLRLEHAARLAKLGNFEWFCTTLSISPHKNAAKLNEIGFELAEKYGVKYLPSDFKKQNGFLRSKQLSSEYNLYRQDYCGCIFSKKNRENDIAYSNND